MGFKMGTKEEKSKMVVPTTAVVPKRDIPAKMIVTDPKIVKQELYVPSISEQADKNPSNWDIKGTVKEGISIYTNNVTGRVLEGSKKEFMEIIKG